MLDGPRASFVGDRSFNWKCSLSTRPQLPSRHAPIEFKEKWTVCAVLTWICARDGNGVNLSFTVVERSPKWR